MLQLAFREGLLPDSFKAFRTLQSKESGASRALLQLARQLGLHRVRCSRSEPWVECVLAMVVGRILYQGSKLSLCNQWANTSLWEFYGIHGRHDVDTNIATCPWTACWNASAPSQKKLAAEHLQNGCLVLCVMTSTSFEGQYKASNIRTHF